MAVCEARARFKRLLLVSSRLLLLLLGRAIGCKRGASRLASLTNTNSLLPPSLLISLRHSVYPLSPPPPLPPPPPPPTDNPFVREPFFTSTWRWSESALLLAARSRPHDAYYTVQRKNKGVVLPKSFSAVTEKVAVKTSFSSLPFSAVNGTHF